MRAGQSPPPPSAAADPSGAPRPAPPAVAAVGTVAVIGTGVIGGGWAAHFLARGYDVCAFDPGPRAAEQLHSLLDAAWPVLTRLGLAATADRSRLRIGESLEDALHQADFVQESTPEQLAAKVEVLARIDAATRPGVIVASSTSGLAMSDMAVGCTDPGRFVVGHPFNPPYLIPLVEICPGRLTSAATVAWAESFYARCGKAPLVMERELPGFIGNRLQEAVWREALHMLAAGEATVEQMDLSITDGPGLRWAQLGPCLTFHLAGGPGGMAHMLDHFGPALLEPWTRLAAPELTGELRDRMVAGCLEEAAGRTISELAAARDEFLADLLLLRQRHRRDVRAPQPAPPVAPASNPAVAASDPDSTDPRQAPFAGLRLQVPEAWIDYNGHMSDWAYAAAHAQANEAFLAALGLSAGYQAATGHTTYTLETRLRFLHEVGRGATLVGRSVLTRADDKRLWVSSQLLTADGTTAARADSVYLHVDQAARKAALFSSTQLELLGEVLAAHAPSAALAGPA